MQDNLLSIIFDPMLSELDYFLKFYRDKAIDDFQSSYLRKPISSIFNIFDSSKSILELIIHAINPILIQIKKIDNFLEYNEFANFTVEAIDQDNLEDTIGFLQSKLEIIVKHGDFTTLIDRFENSRSTTPYHHKLSKQITHFIHHFGQVIFLLSSKL